MFGTYQRLNVPTFAANCEVIRAAREKIAPHHRRGHAMRDARKAFYRAMLDYHTKAQDMALEWRL